MASNSAGKGRDEQGQSRGRPRHALDDPVLPSSANRIKTSSTRRQTKNVCAAWELMKWRAFTCHDSSSQRSFAWCNSWAVLSHQTGKDEAQQVVAVSCAIQMGHGSDVMPQSTGRTRVRMCWLADNIPTRWSHATTNLGRQDDNHSGLIQELTKRSKSQCSNITSNDQRVAAPPILRYRHAALVGPHN